MTEQQKLASEIDELKTKLQTLLADELGKFNGTQPAIFVGRVPASLKPSGLQCVIQPVKEGKTVPLSSGQVLADHHWVVRLINFAAAPNDPKLAIAKRKIEANFVQSKDPRYSPPDDVYLEQCLFYLFAPEVLNAARQN